MAWVRDSKKLKAIKVRAKAMAEKNGHLFDKYTHVDEFWLAECLRCGGLMLITEGDGLPIMGELIETTCGSVERRA